MKSLRSKIYVGLALVLILLLGLSVSSHFSIKNSNQNIDVMVSEDLPFLINNERLILNISQRLAVLRGYLLNGETQYKDLFTDLSLESQQIEKELLELNDEELNNLIQKSINWSGLVQSQIIELYERGDAELALQFLELEAGPLGEELMQEFSKLATTNQEAILSQGDNVISSNQSILKLNLIVSVIAIITGIIVAIIIPKIVVTPVLNVVQRVEKVANGELVDNKLTNRSKDEIGVLTVSINKMVSNLRNLIMKTNTIANQLKTSAERLSVNSDETSKAIEQIASAIQEVSTGSETQMDNIYAANEQGSEISDKVSEIEGTITDIVSFSINTTEKAESGTQVIVKAKKQMDTISARTTELTEIMINLSEKSDEIGKITELISGISEQTNVLALNAVIEAARAKEDGQAFAVVANEVGNLAQKANESSKLITQLIKEVQDDIQRTVLAADGTHLAVKDGMMLVGEAGNEFNSITNAVQNVQLQIEKAYVGINEITNSVQKLVTTNRENAKIANLNSDHTQNIAASAEEQHALMEEIAMSSNKLLGIAENLQNALSTFKV